VLKDEFAVARLLAIELKARLVCEQRLEKRLALDELKVRDIPTAEMQEIESVMDEPRCAHAVGRRLRLGEARESRVVDAAEFAVEISGLQVRKRRDDAWIFLGPVEPVRVSSRARPGQYAPPYESRLALFRVPTEAPTEASRPAGKVAEE
jgi:hypothetical protein